MEVVKPSGSMYYCILQYMEEQALCIWFCQGKATLCKVGLELSYCTNFPSELSTVDIKYKSIQKKDKRKKKKKTFFDSLHPHVEKQMDVLEAVCGS